MIENLTLGTAPDSWGVWFARDDHQVGWKQYLDEIGLKSPHERNARR